MKAFLYDEKHEDVFGELDLGNFGSDESQLLESLIDWLEGHEILNRYKKVVLANSWKRVCNEEYNFFSIEFE